MHRFRLPFLAFGAVLALLVVAVGVAFSPGFQTWLARRVLADQAGEKSAVGRVSAGLAQVVLGDLYLERSGARLHVPALEADLPIVTAAWTREVKISRLVARGWTLDLSGAVPAGPASVPVPGASVPAASDATGGLANHSLSAAREMFAGVFRQLDLPFDLALDGVVLEGEIVLPAQRGRVKVTLSGGGLRAGSEGRFVVTAGAALADPEVSEVDAKGTMIAVMASARSFDKLALQFEASARGTRFPSGVGLRGDVAANRAATGETYAVALVGGGRNLVDLRAALPAGAARLTGTWKLDVRDADVTPFSLGVALPEFALAGEGQLDADAAFAAIHLAGRLDATVDRWHVLRAELAAIGRLNLVADFDLTEQAGTLGVRKLDVAVRGSGPVAEVRTLQAFDFTPATRELRTADTERELFGLVLQGVPVDWLRPWIAGAQVSGGRVRGGLTARAHQGGVSLRSTTPLTVDALAISQSGRALAREVEVALRAAADFTPQGWQAELSEATVRSGHAGLADLEIKVGRLAGAGQAIKLAGRVDVRLPALLAQPGLAGSLVLRSGTAEARFAASFDGKSEVQASVALADLSAYVEHAVVPLPAVTARLRADLAADGAVAFDLPVTLAHAGRRTELTLGGMLGPERNRSREVAFELGGTDVYWDDARLLAAAVPDKPASATAPPPWAGLHGAVTLRLQRVIYSDTLEVKDVGGRLRLDAGIIRLEDGQAAVGERGRAAVNGLVTFDAEARPAYGLVADVAVREFDPAPLFRLRSPVEKPIVEGRFDLQSRLTGHAPTLGGLLRQSGGEIQLTSKGGVFRGLPVSVNTITETTSRWTAWLASAGTAISAVTGRRDTAEVANKTEAVAEVARALHPIVYDQLSVVLARESGRRTSLRDFALISPELRLSGQGSLEQPADGALQDETLALEFVLRARGRQAELLKFLGVIETQTDDLGYAACTVPLLVSGSVGRPDTTELSGRLSALAIEKSGLGEKAAEFLAWIRGGK